MENDKKSTSGSQRFLNLLVIIVCCSLVGLFIYDYIRKNSELADYKNQVKINSEEKDLKLKQIVEGMANLYKETSYANIPEGILPLEESEQIKTQIAKNIAANLSPILLKVGKDQTLTNKKLDKVLKELIRLLKKETAKSKNIRKELAQTLRSERKRQDKLQRNLTQTQRVVGDLNGMVCGLKALYISAHEDDSAMGDISRVASAPAKFVRNTFTFDWFSPTDRIKAEKKIDKKQKEIMDYYNAIGDPAPMKRSKRKSNKKRR